LQNLILSSDVDTFVEFWDFNAFKGLSLENFISQENNETYQEGFFSGIKKGLVKFPARIIQEVEADSYYDFVSYRYDEEKKTYYILFRLFSVETGLNYHDFRVSKRNEQFVFNDIYIYLSGEPLSQTIKRFYIQSIPQKKKLRLFGKKKSQEFENLLHGIALNREGEQEKAFEVLDALEGDLGKEKFVLLIKSQIASELDDKLFMRTIEEMQQAYPNDKTLNINYIDYYTVLEDYDKTFELLDQLMDETQDDFLFYLRGNLNFAKGDIEESKSDFEYIMKNYPDFFSGYSAYIGLLLSLEDYEGAVNTLINLVDQGYEKADLIEFVEEEDEFGYNEFEVLVSSEEYKNWKVN